MHPVYSYIKRELSGIYADSEASAMAKWILTEVFRFSAVDLYAGKDTDFPANGRAGLEDILVRLKRHEPLQYVLGRTFFRGLALEVTPDVLIPRPETAELVGWIVDARPESGLSVLDIGTGSGCIAVSLAVQMRDAKVTAWDVSEKALAVARRNAELNGAEVAFAQADVLGDSCPLVQADVLVSNPPYIPERERAGMERNVLDWEPALALFVPDDDPLLFYRRIARKGLDVLKEGGELYYEINQLYGRETVALLEGMGYKDVELRKDLSGNDRMVKARRA